MVRPNAHRPTSPRRRPVEQRPNQSRIGAALNETCSRVEFYNTGVEPAYLKSWPDLFSFQSYDHAIHERSHLTSDNSSNIRFAAILRRTGLPRKSLTSQSVANPESKTSKSVSRAARLS